MKCAKKSVSVLMSIVLIFLICNTSFVSLASSPISVPCEAEEKDVTVDGIMPKNSDYSFVDSCTTVIENAVNALECRCADYTAVDEALKKIPTDLTPYTEETVKALDDAKNAVITGKNNGEQSIVDGYAIAIENAISALVKKQVEPETPPTSDTSNMALWIILSFILGSAVTVLFNGKKHRKVN